MTFGEGIGASWLCGIGPGTAPVGGICVAAGGAECIAANCGCGAEIGADASMSLASACGVGGASIGGTTLTGKRDSELALSFGGTGAAISFNTTVLLAISCKC